MLQSVRISPGGSRNLGGQRGVVHRVDGHRRHLRVAFVVALVELTHGGGKGRDREDAGHPLHGPHETILVLAQGNILAGHLGRSLVDFEHHAEPVQANVVVAGDGGRVAIEARVLAQLRRTRLQRADDAVMALPDRRQEHRQGCAEHPLRLAWLGEPGQAPQPTAATLPGNLLGGCVLVVDAQQRRHQRQHHQVGDDLVGHAKRSRDRQFPHHRDRDQQQRHEGNQRGHQRQRPGNQQPGEARACRLFGALADGDLAHDEVDLLHAMGNPDGEHQEGHQHCQRIEPVAQQAQAAELPDQRGQRTDQRQQGETQRVAIPVHRPRRQQQRQQTELQHG